MNSRFSNERIKSIFEEEEEEDLGSNEEKIAVRFGELFEIMLSNKEIVEMVIIREIAGLNRTMNSLSEQYEKNLFFINEELFYEKANEIITNIEETEKIIKYYNKKFEYCKCSFSVLVLNSNLRLEIKPLMELLRNKKGSIPIYALLYVLKSYSKKSSYIKKSNLKKQFVSRMLFLEEKKK